MSPSAEAIGIPLALACALCAIAGIFAYWFGRSISKLRPQFYEGNARYVSGASLACIAIMPALLVLAIAASDIAPFVGLLFLQLALIPMLDSLRLAASIGSSGRESAFEKAASEGTPTPYKPMARFIAQLFSKLAEEASISAAVIAAIAFYSGFLLFTSSSAPMLASVISLVLFFCALCECSLILGESGRNRSRAKIYVINNGQFEGEIIDMRENFVVLSKGRRVITVPMDKIQMIEREMPDEKAKAEN